MHFSQARGFAVHRAQNKRKVTLTRREHVSHVTEGHRTIVSIIKKYLGSRIILICELCTTIVELFIVGGKECSVEE